MTIMHEIEIDDLPPYWEAYRCAVGSCPQQSVHVRRRSPAEHVWLIYERPGWVMAAAMPVCPACGTTLTREPLARPETADRPMQHASGRSDRRYGRTPCRRPVTGAASVGLATGGLLGAPIPPHAMKQEIARGIAKLGALPRAQTPPETQS